MNKKKSKIINLIQKGESIPKISKQLNVAKSTIYYHYKKIKGRKFSLTRIPKDDKVLGEFVGAFAGDGSFFHGKKTGHYTIKFHLHGKDDHEYYLYLERLIKNNFNKKLRVYRPKKNQLELSLYSKEIFKMLNYFLILEGKTKNVCLKGNIDDYSDDFLKYFLRGLFDTDGGVNKYRIMLKTISKNLMEQASRILFKFLIPHKLIKITDPRPNCQDCYQITIRKSYIKRFSDEIGLSNPRKLRLLKNAPAENRTRARSFASRREMWQGSIVPLNHWRR